MAKIKTQHARLSAMTVQVRYPVGRADLEYHLIDAGGKTIPETHSLSLVVRAEDASQIAEQFAKLAAAIEAMGGSAQ